MTSAKKSIAKILKKSLVGLCILCMVTLGMPAMLSEQAEASSTPYGNHGRLSVKSGKIVDAKGKPYVIKGISTHGIAWYPQYINQKAFHSIRTKWRANTVRVAVYTEEYGGYCSGGSRTALKKKIDNAVRYAKKEGLYVIIDWHILSDGNPLKHRKSAQSFFRYVAKKYAKNKNVMFEICNEPNGGGGSWKNIKKYAVPVIKTIRSVNKRAIIIVGTPTWSQDVDVAANSPIRSYKNIAYSFHFYAGTHKASMRAKLGKALSKKLPVIVTEFGISQASGNGGVYKKEGDRWIKYLNKYKVGRVCWNLSNKAESSALLRSSCKKTGGWTTKDLSAEGKWLVKAYGGKSSGLSMVVTKKPVSPINLPKINMPIATKKPTSAETDSLKASITKVNAWKEGNYHLTQYKVTIAGKKKTPEVGWQAKVLFEEACSVSQLWNAAYSLKNTKELTLSPKTWNESVSNSDKFEIGFIIKSKNTQKIRQMTVK